MNVPEAMISAGISPRKLILLFILGALVGLFLTFSMMGGEASATHPPVIPAPHGDVEVVLLAIDIALAPLQAELDACLASGLPSFLCEIIVNFSLRESAITGHTGEEFLTAFNNLLTPEGLATPPHAPPECTDPPSGRYIGGPLTRHPVRSLRI